MPATLEPIVPTESDRLAARAGSRLLSQTLTTQETVRLQSGTSEKPDEIVLSGNLTLLVRNLLDAVAAGQVVTVLPVQAELTTNQAADLLGVSRPHLIKLLHEGRIAYRQVGTKRRISAHDLLRYREESKAKRLQTLQSLQDEAQAIDMGY